MKFPKYKLGVAVKADGSALKWFIRKRYMLFWYKKYYYSYDGISGCHTYEDKEMAKMVCEEFNENG